MNALVYHLQTSIVTRLVIWVVLIVYNVIWALFLAIFIHNINDPDVGVRLLYILGFLAVYVIVNSLLPLLLFWVWDRFIRKRCAACNDESTDV